MVDPQPGTDTPDTAPLHTCRNAARSLVLHSPKYKSYNIVLNLGIFSGSPPEAAGETVAGTQIGHAAVCQPSVWTPP